MNKTYLQYLKEPLYQNRKGHFNAISKHQLLVELKLDIDSKDNILNFSYQCVIEELSPLFEFMGDFLIGKKISDVKHFGHHVFEQYWSNDKDFKSKQFPFFDLPSYLLKDAIDDFVGGSHSSYPEDDELICRCFGVHKSEARYRIKNGAKLDLSSFMSMTMAGAGCGECVPAWESIFSSTHRYQGKPNADWILKIQAQLRKNYSENDFSIISFQAGHLKIKSQKLSLKDIESKISENIKITLL